MFVKDNSLGSAVAYMMGNLSRVYDQGEAQSMVKTYFYYTHGFSATDLILQTSQKLSESDLLHLNETVKRLKKKEPLAYILGKVSFHDLELEVNSNVLIPRPETEELVEWILKSEKNPQLIWDFCTGSGCIALALKNRLKKSTIVGIDISQAALEVAYKNGLQHQLNVKWLAANVLEEDFVQQAKMEGVVEQLDIIVSNPPYVLESDKKEMADNVLKFEPELALFVPNSNPLKFYKAIVFHAQYLLKEEGKIYLEIHEDFAEETVSLLQQEGFAFTEIKKDLQGKNRMIKACRSQF